MLRKSLLFLFWSWQVTLTFGQQSSASGNSTGIDRPKLVVGIVVDQMRWDFLYRYYNRYGEGGFKRLLRDGFSCENAMINYLPSYTAVGHSTIFTGSVPSVDGITGNDWTEQLSGKKNYCTDDSTVKGVGSDSPEGKMSPRNLLVSTITDELRIATNYQSKVIGVSLKDRAAILPAGHAANGAFWLDDVNGHFITSTYYMSTLPEWVTRFNDKNEIGQLISKPWNTLYPISTYIQSDSDDEAYEGKFAGESAPVFPHRIKEAYDKNNSSFRFTPFGNTLTLDFAAAAIEGYSLGQGTMTDFLTINCASTDYVGHMYGPNSIEIEDTYLRLDRDLESFFNMLDRRIGKGKWLVFLTADHGVAHTIGYMKKHNLPADFFVSKPIVDHLNQVLANKFGVERLIISGSNYQISFDMARIEERELDFEKIKKVVTDYLRRQPGVSYAVDLEKIGESPIPEPIKTMIINGYNFKRSGPVEVIMDPGWFEGYGKTGTTHGSWNSYDTHIPLVFMGWGIAHGNSNAQIHMTDIAPTLAAILHIQMPNGCVGVPIKELMKKRAKEED
jgi:predicted AlkP superfamily pyrophosphatase or phosphodiesterase